MRFAFLSLIALAAVVSPVVSAHSVRVTVDVSAPSHPHGEGHHAGGLAALAIPEVPHTVPEVDRIAGHEGQRISSEVPHGNRASIEKLREKILDRANRNAGREVLGGHPEEGPDRGATEAEMELIRADKNLAKELQREYQAELKAIQTVEKMAEREEKYRKMTRDQAEREREIDELKDINQVFLEQKRVESERVARFEADLKKHDAWRATKDMTPQQIVDTIVLRSIRQTYTDHELNEDPVKKERLSKELPDFEAKQHLQQKLHHMTQELQKMVDPMAPNPLKKFRSRDWWTTSFGDAEVAQLFLTEIYKSRNNGAAYTNPQFRTTEETFTPAEKTEAMADMAHQIQFLENDIHKQRIQGIKNRIAELDKSIADNNQRMENARTRVTKREQIF